MLRYRAAAHAARLRQRLRRRWPEKRTAPGLAGAVRPFVAWAFAYATARYAQENSSQPWRVVAAVALLLAAAAVLICLWKTLRSAVSRRA